MFIRHNLTCNNGISKPFPFFNSKLKASEGRPLTSFYSKQQQHAVSRTATEMFDHRAPVCTSEEAFNQLHFCPVRDTLKNRTPKNVFIILETSENWIGNLRTCQ